MRRVFRILGIALLAVVGLLLLAGATAWVVGGRAWNRTYEIPTTDLTIPADDSSIARGRHFAGIFGCVDCHGPDLGGLEFADGPPFRINTPNLTTGRGGIGGAYTPADWERSIRHGVRPNGTSLFIMPARAYHRVADRDIAALIAYLQRVPPVDRELPGREIRPLGRVLGAGPMDPSFEVMLEPARRDAPPAGPTAEYGAYLTSLCAYCHGDDLRGMKPPDPESPLAPDLSAAGQWSMEAFDEFSRTGVRPDGRPVNEFFMPWTILARMTEDDRRAIHAHLATLAGSAPAAAE